MRRIGSMLRNSWEKNWPEVHCAFSHGLPRFVLGRGSSEPGSGVPVFCYHLVEAEAFQRDLEFLASNGYATLHADELLDHLQERRRAGARSVVLSFDDGAVNLYRIVFPLLRRYGMCAVAFVAPRFHRDDAPPLAGGCGEGASRPCTWSEIQEMDASGCVDFQSHTYEHRYVPRWPEPAPLVGCPDRVQDLLRSAGLSLKEDFMRSKATLEDKLNKTVRHLAFPRYNGTDAAIQIGKACGYDAFWWGTLPHRPDNAPGQPATRVVRISGEFLRRLPGRGRVSLGCILRARYAASALNWWKGAANS